MKKILFICRSLDYAGGVESSFINLIDNIKDMYDIDVFAFSISDYYSEKLKDSVNLIKANKFIEMLGKMQKDYKKSSYLYWLRAILVLVCRIFGNKYIIRKILNTQKLESKYDDVISYMQAANKNALSDGNNQFALENVEATKRIVFIHSDYKQQGFDNDYHYQIYSKFDIICTVSESCAKQIINCVPDFKNKVKVIHNFYNIQKILELSDIKKITYNENIINFVTVARLSEEKGLFRVLEVLKDLKHVSNKFCWHIIGGGSLKDKMESYIEENKMSKQIIMYGEKKNPYPYIKNSDFLLVSSLHEAAPMVIGEAKILKIPVISTETLSAREQIKCREGIVCENSQRGLYDVLEKIIRKEIDIKQMKEEYNKLKFSNNQALEEVREIF